MRLAVAGVTVSLLAVAAVAGGRTKVLVMQFANPDPKQNLNSVTDTTT